MWAALRKNRLGFKFRRQQVVDGFIVDFYCHGFKVVVEVDGPNHAKQQEADQQRDEILRCRGLTILRFANAEVLADLPAVVAAIESACRSR